MFVLCEVGLVITKTDFAKGGDKFVMRRDLGNRKVPREARRVAEDSAKAVTGVEDEAMQPAEGEVAGADVVEGGLGGGCVTGGEGC